MIHEAIWEAVRKWVAWGECITVEFNLEDGTATKVKTGSKLFAQRAG